MSPGCPQTSKWTDIRQASRRIGGADNGVHPYGLKGSAIMHQTNKQVIDKLLNILGNSLRAMDDRELDLLLQGKGTLRFTPTSPANEQLEPEPHLWEAAMEIAKQLAGVETREAAREVITSIDRPRRRGFLLLIAQAAGVRVGSRDSIARIEQKLIQSTVGSKLRSRAFREVSF